MLRDCISEDSKATMARFLGGLNRDIPDNVELGIQQQHQEHDIGRRKSATLGKEEKDNVKAKLNRVHKLLKKQVSFAEDVEVVDVDSKKKSSRKM